MIAYITSKGSLGDYIKKYLDETDASEEIPSWNDLKRIYKKSIRGNHGPPTRVSSNAQELGTSARPLADVK